MHPSHSPIKSTYMRALIIGISGQDGTYLANLLLKKGYTVVRGGFGFSDRGVSPRIASRNFVTGCLTSDVTRMPRS